MVPITMVELLSNAREVERGESLAFGTVVVIGVAPIVAATRRNAVESAIVRSNACITNETYLKTGPCVAFPCREQGL